MPTFIAWGNSKQNYLFNELPSLFLTPKLLHHRALNNAGVQRRHRCRWLAHYLLWQLIIKANIRLDILNGIEYTSTGRPYFKQSNSLIDFNISHSGDWVAIILSTSNLALRPVGIDIELPEKPRNFSAILAQFASQQEQHWFNTQINKSDAFYFSWCMREAILKTQGTGIINLSEVKYHPIRQTIYSRHCPTGKLIFTSELPFYLAYFIETNTTKMNRDIYYFNWQDDQLQSATLLNTACYLANP